MSQKVAKLFNCELCDYNTSKKCDMKKHLLTSKHLKLTTVNISKPKNLKNKYICVNCKKDYTSRVGIWKHQKICINSEQVDILNTQFNQKEEDINKSDIIKQLIIQNQQLLFDNKEFKELIMDQSSKMIDQSSKMMEQNSKLIEIAAKPYSITNNNNCHNKQFNLNVFLNEKCKNAMNINDFVNSLQIVSEDFENIGKLGYIQGISNIFIKGLKDLDETIRPMHCTDKKRETLYIKDIEGWNKDDNKDKIKTIIKEVADKNLKYIPIWQEDNPTYYDGTTKKNDQYMRIVNQVMTAIVPDDETGLNKIIKNVVNEICVDK